MIIIIIIKITEFGNSTDFDEAAYQGLYCLPSEYSYSLNETSFRFLLLLLLFFCALRVNTSL